MTKKKKNRQTSQDDDTLIIGLLLSSGTTWYENIETSVLTCVSFRHICPISRLDSYTVFAGFIAAWFLAASPLTTSLTYIDPRHDSEGRKIPSLPLPPSFVFFLGGRVYFFRLAQSLTQSSLVRKRIAFVDESTPVARRRVTTPNTLSLACKAVSPRTLAIASPMAIAEDDPPPSMVASGALKMIFGTTQRTLFAPSAATILSHRYCIALKNQDKMIPPPTWLFVSPEVVDDDDVAAGVSEEKKKLLR